MKRFSILLVLASTFLSAPICYPQQSQYSVFPLAVGLEYRYEYFAESIARDMLHYFRVSLDSGLVSYIVRDSIRTNDSVVAWRLLSVSSLKHWRFSRDTTYYTYDTSTTADLIESLSDRHELKCSTLVWSFPLSNPLQPIYRFADSPFVKIGRGEFLPFSSFTDTLWFRSDSGFARRLTSSNVGSIQNGTSSNRRVRLLSTPSLAVEEGGEVTTTLFRLFHNYPNPFNPSTTITFIIGQPAFVRLMVFDVLGREVSSLVNEKKDVGKYEVGFDALNLSSGVYFYRLSAGDFVKTNKMVVLH